MVGFFQHPDFLQQGQRARLSGQRLPAVDVLKRQGDVLAGGEVGIKIELLKHKPHAASQLAQPATGELSGRLVVDQDLPAAQGFKLVDEKNQGGFTGTRRTEDGDHFSGRDGEVNVV